MEVFGAGYLGGAVAKVDSTGKYMACGTLDTHPEPSMHPSYWEAQGYNGNWGDASVNSPWMRIMRKEESGTASYVILSALLDWPVIIYGKTPSWGQF